MKILVGISSHSTAKDYMHEKLVENMRICVMDDTTHVIAFGDREIPGLPMEYTSSIHSYWQDDFTYDSREAIRAYAKENNYDAFIWQGSDCLYPSLASFEKFVDRAAASDYDAIGALTAGRNRPEYAVARRFVHGTKAQKDISFHELSSGEIVSAGFPGADALLVKKSLFHLSWKDWNYVPWYDRTTTVFNEPSLCIEEFWCAKVIEKGFKIGLDTACRTWHVHETGLAARWPNETRQLGELHWK